MSLVWHIAKKDLRRMAWPAALWLGFIGATTMWFCLSSPTVVGEFRSAIGEWLAMTTIWTRIIVSVQLVIGYVLAGSLVLDDALVGAEQFWATRPIANARLLAAKLLAAVMLFMVGPGLMIAVILVLTGSAGIGGALHAGGAMAVGQLLPVFVALMVASLARNLAQFLLCTVVLCLGYFVCGVGVELLQSGPLPRRAILLSRELLVGLAPLPVAAIVLAQQFLTRRTAGAWLTLVVALGALAGLRVAWPWDVFTTVVARKNAVTPASDRAAAIIAAPSLRKWQDDSREVPQLRVTAPWSAEGFYVPVSGSIADRDGRLAFKLGAGWEAAALRALGFSHDAAPLDWTLNALGDMPPRITGELEIWFTTARLLGEMPLRERAELTVGESRTRILGLERTGDRLDAVFVQEIDVQLEAGVGPAALLTPGIGGLHVDQYVLVQRSTGRAQPLSPSLLDRPVAMNSVVVACRRLHVAGNDDWRGAVLAKVRFERVRSFERPFAVAGLTNGP